MAESWMRVKQTAPARSLLRLHLAVFVFTILATCPAWKLEAATFTATLDPGTVTVGDSATLSLRFEGGDPRRSPLPGDTQPAVQATGQSHSTTIFGGQVTSIFEQQFQVTPTQPGDYVIPALQAQAGGQTLTSQPLRLKVVKAEVSTGGSEGDKEAFLKIVVPKKEVFIGEVIPVEFLVCFRDGVGGEGIMRNFENYEGCPLKAEGVSVLKTGHLPRRRMRAGNFNYTAAVLVCAVSPVRAGTLTINGMSLDLQVQVPVGQGGFVHNFQTRTYHTGGRPSDDHRASASSDQVPPTFTGAVGNYTMTVTAVPTNVAVGDPLTVKVQISGSGAFDSLALPEQASWKDFKTYPPTSKIDTTDVVGVQGTKIFDQEVIPQKVEIKQLPPVTFSFFNPDKKAYQTLASPAIPIIVRPSGAAPPPPAVLANQSTAENAPPSPDIVHIKPRLGPIAQINLPLVQRPGSSRFKACRSCSGSGR